MVKQYGSIIGFIPLFTILNILCRKTNIFNIKTNIFNIKTNIFNIKTNIFNKYKIDLYINIIQ
jgi:hypothetical protein